VPCDDDPLAPEFRAQTALVKTFGGPIGEGKRRLDDLEGGDIANSTGVVGIWRPKQSLNALVRADPKRTAVLGYFRDSDDIMSHGCARIGPHAIQVLQRCLKQALDTQSV
jgi:hypothetical protein